MVRERSSQETPFPDAPRGGRDAWTAPRRANHFAGCAFVHT